MAVQQVVALRVQYKLEVQGTKGEMFGYALLRILWTLFTLGIASFFLPYAWTAKVLNGTRLRDAQGKTWEQVVNLRAMDQLGHIVKWFSISLVTVGLALPFYYAYGSRRCGWWGETPPPSGASSPMTSR